MAERPQTEIRTRPLAGGYGWYYFDAISLDGRWVLVATWHSGYLFSPRYYDEILELKDRGWIQPEEDEELADPTNYGAFGFALYDRGRTEAYVIVEATLVRGGSDPWFPNLHAGESGIGISLPTPGATLGVGENRITREEDGTFRVDFSDRSKWLKVAVEGNLKVRPLAGGSGIIPLSTEGAAGKEVAHEWQIIASRAEITGRIRWRQPITGRKRSLDLEALGYLDRNTGRLPISPQVDRWLWGRFQGSEKTIAYYRLDPAHMPLGGEGGEGGQGSQGGEEGGEGRAKEFLFFGDRSGGSIVEGGRISAAHVRRNRWGMPHPLEMRGSGGGLEWSASVARDIDRGPFHVRCLNRLDCADPALDGVVGITECFVPARWDIPLFRLLTRGRIRRGP